MFVSGAANHKAEVKKVSEDKTTVCVEGEITACADTEDFNDVKKPGDEIGVNKVEGTLTAMYFDVLSGAPSFETYEFESYDKSVRWVLSREQFGGSVPQIGKGYTLCYYDNGTTADNKPCSDAPELECECEVYDDIFLTIFVLTFNT